MKSFILTVAVLLIGLVGCERVPSKVSDRQSEATTALRREIAAPSGDWVAWIDYTYGRDGRLLRASYELRTFNGYEQATEAFRSTKCVRDYVVSASGELLEKSRVTTDLTTGEPAERTFYEPELTHWMTLAEARN
jgi:hypothetical protein